MPKSAEKSRPCHIPDSQFGICYDPEQLLRNIHLNELESPTELIELPHGYIRPWKDPTQHDAGSTVFMDKHKYKAMLDVFQFKPEELKVTIEGVHMVAVEGNQVKKEEHGGLVDRYFKRKYLVPPFYDCQKVKCKMSADRIIVITIPRLDPKLTEEKIEVPLVQTEQNIRDEVKELLEKIKEDNY
ncbi:heat shock protein 23-like [Harmonia axyridis]|uniref:heat shock protein 23-like n=1 Tax=Harmonia axyridis TaxID=115357 RepID=UPI001E276E41|nr:heat shock protein 23-like [Harmonia axyridis]